MASLETNLRNLALRVANEAKALRTLINGNTADNSALTTTAKANLVAAVNEVRALAVAAGSAGAQINDGSTSAGAVWSSQKVTDAIAALEIKLLGPGVSAALDTFRELGDQLAADQTALSALSTGLSKRVRVDTAQGLTAAEQLQARQNIGAVSTTDVGDTSTDFVSIFNTALA